MATSVSGQSHSHLFFVLERSSHRRFLVDTGAAVSVLPPVKSDRQHSQSGVHLLAANGTAILTFGTRSLTLNLGLRRPFRWGLYNRRGSSSYTGRRFSRTPQSLS